MIRIDWEYPEVPEYDPDIHDPDKVFAFMCIEVFTMQSGFI